VSGHQGRRRRGCSNCVWGFRQYLYLYSSV
jgi:hypothetical protein